MSAKILVVDDEPDLEGLILQKFRRQIRDGSVSFLFAHDGVEALTMLDWNRDVDMVLSDINMPRMDGLSLAWKAPGRRREPVDGDRVRVRRHGEHPDGDEPRCVRFRHQADRLRRS